GDGTTDTLAPFQGPIRIFGGAGPDSHELRTAVMLPSELPTPPLSTSAAVDESQQTDTLVVHDDGAATGQTGTLSATNLSGFGLGTGSVDVLDEDGNPIETVAAGITFADAEVLELLLRSG